MWSLAPSRPWFTRSVSGPYNYVFADNPPANILDAATGPATPMLGQLMWTTTTTALTTGGLTDLWGDPNDVLRYVKASTLKVTAGAWAAVCRRSDVQRVLNEFWRAHSSRVNRYALAGRFPITGVLDIRVSAVDSLAGAPAGSVGLPLLAATSRVAGRPDLDTVVWLGVLTKPNERYSDDFFCETEQWLFANYSSYAVPRAEWSKGWAYTAEGAYRDSAMLGSRLPAADGAAFAQARTILNTLDPARVFSSPLLDDLLP